MFLLSSIVFSDLNFSYKLLWVSCIEVRLQKHVFYSFAFRLHEVLMDLQQQQLQQLSDWLTQTEKRIKRIEMEPAPEDMEVYKEKIEQHKVNKASKLNLF